MAADQSVQEQCSLTIPNQLSYLPVVLGFVSNIAHLHGFSDIDARRIELAVEEAVTNVIEHAFGPDEEASFDVICNKIAAGMEVCIHDMGMPWDPAADDDYEPDVELERRSGHGLGEYLIKHVMDEYVFDNLGRNGKQVRLVKYLDAHHIGEEHEGLKIAEEGAPPLPKQEKTVEVEIRRMLPEEAVEVSRAVFDCYGYSYAGEFIYYPERIVAMNENGEMLSAVAVIKETGEVAGHAALLFNERLPAELAIVVTKHKFRSMGTARMLGEYLVDQAREMGLKGLYVKEVTVHPYTQKFCRKLGYGDCGLLLAHSPKSLSFKGIADTAKQRNSDLLGFKSISEPEPRNLYLPERHKAIIEKIYADLLIPMKWSSKAVEPERNEQTVMEVTVNSTRSLCEIHITHYGADLDKMLKQEIRRISQFEVQLVEMYLNLTNPVTPWVVTEAEKLGFFFTGILPETKDGDSVVMQFFNGIVVDYDELVIDRSETVQLLEYVMALDPSMV